MWVWVCGCVGVFHRFYFFMHTDTHTHTHTHTHKHTLGNTSKNLTKLTCISILECTLLEYSSLLATLRGSDMHTCRKGPMGGHISGE